MIASGENAHLNGSSSGKRVQVVGEPPAFHGVGRKQEPSRGAESDEEEEEQQQLDENTIEKENEDKTRTVGDGEVKDEDLLAEFDEDEDVRGRAIHSTREKYANHFKLSLLF